MLNFLRRFFGLQPKHDPDHLARLLFPGCRAWLMQREDLGPPGWPRPDDFFRVAWLMAQHIAREPLSSTDDGQMDQMDRALAKARETLDGG